MGTFPHPNTLLGPSGSGTATLDALVNTGTTFTIALRLANGEVVEWDLGEVVAQLDEVRATVFSVFGKPPHRPLSGDPHAGLLPHGGPGGRSLGAQGSPLDVGDMVDA